MAQSIGNVRLMQQINRDKVLSYIRKNSPVSRNELAKISGLSLSSITNIVNYLLEYKLVTATGSIKAKGAGRKAAKLEFNPGAMKLVSVNIEKSEAEIVLTDLNGGVISGEKVPLGEGKSPDYVLGIIEERISEMIKSESDVKGIGFAVSGHVSELGEVSSISLGWDKLAVKERLEKRFSVDVCTANNTKTKGLWTVTALNDADHRNIIFLDMSDGVGIAAFYDGKINESVSGEIGHIAVDEKKSLESVCSIRYIEESYKAVSGEALRLSEVCELFCKGEALACVVVEDVIGNISAAISGIILAFEPDMIIINGSELFEHPKIYEKALYAAYEQGSRLAMKRPCFMRVNVASAQAAQGAAQLAADTILSGII